MGIKFLIVSLIETLGFNPQLFEDLFRHLTVFPGALDRLSPTVAQKQPLAHLKLVASRMPAEVVVIVENQNSGLGSRLLAIEIGRRQTADAAANHYQVVFFVGVSRIPCTLPKGAIAQRVGHIKSPWLASPHAIKPRRIGRRSGSGRSSLGAGRWFRKAGG